MARRKFINIPKVASITCPHCKETSKRKVPEDSSPQYFDCDKCHQRTQTPITSCCIVCAFTNAKCVPSLKQVAFSKKLVLR